ncbi:E3 ubiquitin-protein ligase RFWD3-like isoform X2 [Panicum virgatum]|uniref:E3 ubiquitin-protein ligase RFWD3-like isoform X2 n=1 Tax=Panicum virgatum TaxID=38727 RepID=UPI0019D64575|nr:E3 ubiquitin-protein ligase RFWD3-like isoform X2 [Panicum virgatum]
MSSPPAEEEEEATDVETEEEDAEEARVSAAAAADEDDSGETRTTCCVCMEPSTCSGAHRLCCIPCGHVYGRSCLENWLSACGNTSAKVSDMLLHGQNSCSTKFHNALSVVKHFNASILSTSTYQGICGMVAVAYRK